MAAKIAKILAAFADKKKLGKKLGILVLSIAFGLIFLLVLPVVVMKSLGNLSGNSVAPTLDPAYLTESNIKANICYTDFALELCYLIRLDQPKRPDLSRALFLLKPSFCHIFIQSTYSFHTNIIGYILWRTLFRRVIC